MTDLSKLLKSVPTILPKYRRYLQGRYLQVGLTLFTGIGLSAIASLVVYNWERKLMQTDLQTQLDKIAANIQRDVNANLEVVRAIGAIQSGANKITEQDFQQVFHSSVYLQPSFQAIAWLPRISDRQRLDYEKTAKTEVHSNYQIVERTHSEKFVRAKQRAEYFPIQYVFPNFVNKNILGFDLASMPTERAVLEQAILQKVDGSNDLFVTGRTQIIETTDIEPNFLVFLPVYEQSSSNRINRNATPKLPPLQQQNLRGFVMGVFQFESLMRSALEGVKLNNVNLYLQDISTAKDEKFLAFYQTEKRWIVTDPTNETVKPLLMGKKPDCGDYSGCTRILNLQNRRWLIRLLLVPEYLAPQKYWRAWGTLALGLFLTRLAISYLVKLLKYTEEIEEVVGQRTAQSQQLQAALQELQHTQSQLVQTEKMSSLGLLVAGIAHEVNNPLNFIYGNLQYTNQYAQDLLQLIELYQQYYPNPCPEVSKYSKAIDFEFISEDMPKMLSSMQMGAQRIVEIIQSLKNFSRSDEGEIKCVNIHEGIDSSLLILQNKLKAKHDRPAIEVIKNYGALPSVECYVGQLNQVFMNILVNGIDAIESYNEQRGYEEILENPARITIHTEYLHKNNVVVRIADNGSGMSQEVKKRLFDPFFTTKPVGKGTGLGLSISYQIVVDKHKGALWCESTPGQGTEFWIKIPVRQEEFISSDFEERATVGY